MLLLLTSQLTRNEGTTSKWSSVNLNNTTALLTMDGEKTNRDFQRHTKAQRQKSLDEMHAQLKKYISSRLQAALVSKYFIGALSLDNRLTQV